MGLLHEGQPDQLRADEQLRKYTGRFAGNGTDLFLIKFVNQLLTLVTLGIWHAWAKARVYRYVMGHMEFAGHRLRFTADGWTIFKGFVRAGFILAGLYLFLFGGQAYFEPIAREGQPVVGAIGIFVVFILFFAGFVLFTEFAWFASRRFKAANTAYREIRFKLDARPGEFLKPIIGWRIVGFLSSGLLLPFYYFHRMRRLSRALRYGSLRFDFDGNIGDYFALNIKGYFLTMFTLGIYGFWWVAELKRYRFRHLLLQGSRFRLDMATGDYIGLVVGNFFLIILTLGIALPWVTVRTQRFFMDRISLEGPLDLDDAWQRSADEGHATGEGLEEFFDMDMGIGF